MRVLSLTFQAAAIGIALGASLAIAHKAGSDYCITAPEPDPFDPLNYRYDKTLKHRQFCAAMHSLERYNGLYFPAADNQ